MKKDSVSFEDKLKALEVLTFEIEAGEISLNDATKKFAEAKQLADELEEMLGVAKAKIDEELEEEEEEEE